MEERLEDKALGSILVCRNNRSRRISFRPCDEGIRATVPVYVSLKEVAQAVERLRERLTALRERFEASRGQLTPDYLFHSEFFSFLSCEGEVENPRTRFLPQERRLECVYPPAFPFLEKEFQQWLTAQMQDALRQAALCEFPLRLQALAVSRGLSYEKVHISCARTRWGSCSFGRHISLSRYLLLLPRHLQDYVMHHELTHLLEMNHGERFHRLLDNAVGGHDREYARQLAAARLPFWTRPL